MTKAGENNLNSNRELNLALQMTSARTLDEIFEKIYLYLHEAWGFDSVGIQLVDDERKLLKSYKSYGVNIEDPRIAEITGKDVSLEKMDSVSALAALQGFPLYADFTKAEFINAMTEIDRQVVLALNIKENLILPLKFENQILGVFHCTTFFNPVSLQRSDIEQLHGFINGLSGVIHLTRERLKLEKLKENQESLIVLIRRIGSTLNLSRLSDLLCREIMRAGGGGCAVLIQDDEGQSLVIEGIALSEPFKEMERINLKNRISLSSDDVTVQCFKEKKILIYEKKDYDSFSALLQRKFHLRELNYLVEIPIFSAEEQLPPIGVVSVYGYDEALRPRWIEKWKNLIQLFFTPLMNAFVFTRLKDKEQGIEKESGKNRRVLQIAEKLNQISSYQTIAASILKGILETFNLDLGALFLKNHDALIFQGIEHSPQMDVARVEQIRQVLDSMLFSISQAEGAMVYCYLQNTLVYFSDFQAVMHLPMHPKDYAIASMLSDVGSHLMVPIRQEGQPVGVIILSSLKKEALSGQDIPLIESLCAFSGSALSNAETYALAQRQKKTLEEKDFLMQEDLKMAERIQRSILISDPLPSGLGVCIHYQPQNRVGGDFYQTASLPDGRDRFFIADATGHVVQAALGTLLIRNEYERFRLHQGLPHEILNLLNQAFLKKFPDLSLFFTGFLLDIDLKNQKACFSCAGHPAQYRVRESVVLSLHTPGKPLGVVNQARYESCEIPLSPRDRFFLFTDGMIEETNPSGEEFGEERFTSLLNQSEISLPELPFLLQREVFQFSGRKDLEDDFTFIGIEVEDPGGG